MSSTAVHSNPRLNRFLGFAVVGLTLSAMTLGTLVVLDDESGADRTTNAQPGGASGGGVPASPGAPGGSANGVTISADDLNKLVGTHTKALTDRDEKAFLAAFDPAQKDLVDRQRKTFANLKKVPMTGTSFEAIRQHGRASDSFGRGVTLTVDVVFHHQITNVDLAPVGESYTWTVTRASAGAPVQVTKVEGTRSFNAERLGEAATQSYPAPWDLYDDITVVKRPHVLLIGDTRLAALHERYADTAEQAAVYNLGAWKGVAGTAPGFAVSIEDSRDKFKLLYNGVENNGGNEAGLSTAMVAHGNVKKPYAGSRVSLDASSNFFDGSHPNGPREIMRHEMAHSLLWPVQGIKGPPLWIDEGFAEWMASRDVALNTGGHWNTFVQRIGTFNDKLPDDKSLRAEDSGVTNFSYQLGALAMRFIAERFGEQKVWDFVSAMYADGSALEASLRTATGLGQADFEKQWSTYVRSVAR